MKDTFWKEKLFRYIDRYNRAFNTGDWLIHKEAENDILNFICNLQEQQVKETEDRIINRAVKVIEEYEVKKEPLCDLNVILRTIIERIKIN